MKTHSPFSLNRHMVVHDARRHGVTNKVVLCVSSLFFLLQLVCILYKNICFVNIFVNPSILLANLSGILLYSHHLLAMYHQRFVCIFFLLHLMNFFHYKIASFMVRIGRLLSYNLAFRTWVGYSQMSFYQLLTLKQNDRPYTLSLFRRPLLCHQYTELHRSTTW